MKSQVLAIFGLTLAASTSLGCKRGDRNVAPTEVAGFAERVEEKNTFRVFVRDGEPDDHDSFFASFRFLSATSN
jgi:hypothetical protein